MYSRRNGWGRELCKVRFCGTYDLGVQRSEGPVSALAAFRCVRIRVQAAVGFEGAKVGLVRKAAIGT